MNFACLLFLLFFAINHCGAGTGPLQLCRPGVRGAELLNRQDKHFRGTARHVVAALG